MALLNEKEENNYQTFSCDNAEVTFDNNGYIVKAKDSHLLCGVI